MSSKIRQRAVGYITSIAGGAVMEQLGRKMWEQSDTSPPVMQTPKGQEYSDKMTAVQQKPFEESYAQSFNPLNWQLPNVGRNLRNTFKYAVTTTPEERREDFSGALKETGKRAVEAVWNAPEKIREIPKQVQVVKENYDAFQHDSDALEKQSTAMMQRKSAEMVRSFGRNAMLKSPGYLIPGVAGLLYRSFFTAKMVGNAGRQINEVNEMLEKTPGPFKEQIQKRIDKQ